ncbi:MAG: damage-control phosphatase ARMT1 family protein [Candidatus Freyarchaeota archaeon]
MKVKFECAPCMLHRGYMEITEATNDESLRFKAMAELMRFMAENFKPTETPARLITMRDRIVRRITGNPDPYARRKEESNRKAMELLPKIKGMVLSEESQEARFRKACLCAIVGNIMEFGILGHSFKFKDLLGIVQQAERDLAIDDISKIFSLAKRVKNVIYLTDNAGEIAFDTLLVQELRRLGTKVVVAVKAGPIVNDATLEDARYVGMHEVADEVVTIGADTVGLILEECSQEFLNLYQSADLVIAKGMGYAEALTEYDLTSPHAFLLRTKCNMVANFFGVDRNKNIAKLM